MKEWYDSTLYSRLDSKKDDVIIIVMQRVHEDDLVGHVLAKDSDWVHLDLPAIAEEAQSIEIGDDVFHERAVDDVLHPGREPREILERTRAEMGSMLFSAQYQQRPVPTEGNIVKWEWFRTYINRPAYGADGRLVQSWDTASKAGELNDYSACTTWLVKDRDYYLLDVMRERLEYPLLRKRVLEMKQKWGAHTVLIEDRASGTQLIQDLKRSKEMRPIAIDPETDKVTRMSNQSAKIEAGQVWLPEQAPWLDTFKAEMLAFPFGKFDDQVDSVSQFIWWQEDRVRRVLRSGRVIGV